MTATGNEPGYLSLAESGELDKRVQEAIGRLENCMMCPRQCGVNRLAGDRGFCRTARDAVVSSYAPHFGEERPLVGSGGSGTIFITHCNLQCVFCQNYEISHKGEGVEVSAGQLAAVMVSLQKQGCHNINFVTPSHVTAQILEALPLAIERGLNIPLVYNSSGYDLPETLELLNGVFDIYMPDFKFWDRGKAKTYLQAEDYPERARKAVAAMYCQVGDLAIDDRGTAISGLLVRHLVMPGAAEDTRKIMHFLATEISRNTYVNIMEQYRPCGEAYTYPEIGRPLTHEEYEDAVKIAREEGLTRLDEQNLERLFRFLGLGEV